MNSNELKFFIACTIMATIVLTALIGCVTYYNITSLRTEQIASGKPANTVLCIHKLNDEQFAQLIDSFKVDKEKSDEARQ